MGRPWVCSASAASFPPRASTWARMMLPLRSSREGNTRKNSAPPSTASAAGPSQETRNQVRFFPSSGRQPISFREIPASTAASSGANITTARRIRNSERLPRRAKWEASSCSGQASAKAQSR